FVVTSYELVDEVVKRNDLFSNRFAVAMGQSDPPEAVRAAAAEGYRVVDTMLTADDPEHRRYRGLVNKAFTPRRIDRIAASIEDISRTLIDAFAGDAKVEILSQYAVQLPLTVIADQLGVPREDLPRFKRWTDGFVAQLGGLASGDEAVEAARRIVEFQHYFAEKLEEARREPREDIISDLVRASLEDERPLETAESLSILQQLLVAGNETTADAIAEGCLLLARHPETQQAIREDPARIPGLVDEVLRLSTPTANMWRVAAEDTTLGGVAIKKGAFLLVSFASANRDESRFSDPDRFDPSRGNAKEQIAFGHGVHACVGAPLARREMQTAFGQLLSRIGPFTLCPDAAPPRYRPNILLHGLETLKLRFAA
ncbi:MAG: cytochrome P450, partial [Myxococcota bacterium]